MCLTKKERKELLSNKELDAWEEGGVTEDEILDRVFAKPGNAVWRRCEYNPVTRVSPGEETFLGCHKEATKEYVVGEVNSDENIFTDVCIVRIWLCEEHYDALWHTLYLAACRRKQERESAERDGGGLRSSHP